MTFASPQWLILLLALPFIWTVGWPRYAFRRRRDIISLLLRTALVVMVIFAVSGLQIVRAVDRLAVVFLVDASDSLGADLREAQIEYIREAIADKPTDDEWAVIVFGADVSIDTPFTNVTELTDLRSSVVGNNSDLGSAIQTAISLFPADARRRIVILSDGQQTIGDAESRARLAEASGVDISYVLFSRPAAPDVRIAELEAPARVAEGQEFDVTITVESEEPTEATLLLFAGDQLVQEQAVTLQAGTNRYSLAQRGTEGGFLNFSAQVVAPESSDDFTQNNRLSAFSEIVGPPRVLIVSSIIGDVQNLIPALESSSIQIDYRTPSQLPPDLATLATYESIVLVNVPAPDLSVQQMEQLDRYVRDIGGGLVFIGGPDSYGPGGYFQTPLEQTLPVNMQIRDQQRLPQLTIAYLLDRSGSMGVSTDGSFTNLQLAQRAVTRSLEFLQPTDRVAIGTFDSGGAWVAEFQEVANRRRLQDAVGSLRPGGGTDIASGIALVERDIINEPSERKHFILLTDGGASQGALEQRVFVLNRDYGVTVSVIAIGTNQPGFLGRMAERGQGNYHVVENAGQIPTILAQETVLATRSYIEEGNFPLTRTSNSPILSGFTDLPTLAGYVATTEKDTAQVVLRGPEPFADPILVTWQYGLGRAVAFTSDATSRWATNWALWDGFPRFWAQAIDWSITETANNNIETQVIMLDEGAQVVIDARNEAGVFLNGLVLETNVIAPDGSAERVVLQQTAPGRYEGRFEPETEGAYFLSVQGNTGADEPLNEVSGWVMSYSPEYATTDPNEALLEALAEITGGQSLADAPNDVFAASAEPRTAISPVWPYLLIAALLLLPFDIAIRRLLLNRSDWRRFRRWVFNTPDPNAAPDERMSSLLGARERARAQTRMGERDVSTISALRRVRDNRDVGDEDTPQTPVTPQPPPQPSNTPTPSSEASESNTVSNLLRRKRDRDE